ncbi:hypothetical protein [Extibacter muris]|uniref:hypothetical protein n=1 Tax=Extibacter muris TaxID=1796622 RepID=UPI001D06A300|nr:hypothetical protein [Extibacter muris]MCB6202681.1 hypothetical protein [Extibacter muris]MCQ4664523.1 hypothetical protein [Extibacter muris]MCQ4693732.1 hypothetical protein [Extibacter muris]
MNQAAEAFHNRVIRNVNKDAAIHLSNECYDAPMQFIGQMTYALRCFMNGLNPNQYQTAYISLSTISVTEFYQEFCEVLGLEPLGNKTGMFRAIQERMYYLYREKKHPLILVGEPDDRRTDDWCPAGSTLY